MQRALVSIGIQKTGGLPELAAARASAAAFAEWARTTQQMPEDRIRLVTDEKGKVGRERLFDEIEQITQLGFVEQLIVYFSGHGINSGLYEQWLLSRAPDDPGAAVNLRGSEMLARFSGIGHVVFISDACRTAADSIQAQGITGGEIFPNPSARGAENPVDQYFATLVGNPAYEVKVVQDAVARYRAAYTTVMLDALQGKVPAVVDSLSGRRLVRPRPLKKHLAQAVPDYMHALGLAGGQTQQPDARIESDETAWLADLGEAPPAIAPPAAKRAGAPRRRTPPGSLAAAGAFEEEGPLPAPGVLAAAQPRAADVARQAQELLTDLLAPASASTRRAPLRRGGAPAAAPGMFERAMLGRELPFGPDHFETQCGIKLRGARVVDAGSRQAQAQVGQREDVVQLNLHGNHRGADVLVQLHDGSAVVVPAFRGYITSLGFDAQGLLDEVACEPSANTPQYPEWRRAAGELDRLRAAIGAASSLGVFRLEDGPQGEALLQKMRALKLADPVLAVHAAWALHDRRMRTQIAELQRQLEQALGVRVFDVAMLAFSLQGKSTHGTPAQPYPCVPMLSQGWALLSALQVELPARLAALRAHLLPSPWTHFAPAALKQLQAELR